MKLLLNQNYWGAIFILNLNLFLDVLKNFGQNIETTNKILNEITKFLWMSSVERTVWNQNNHYSKTLTSRIPSPNTQDLPCGGMQILSQLNSSLCRIILEYQV